jgi:hypothetical protein
MRYVAAAIAIAVGFAAPTFGADQKETDKLDVQQNEPVLMTDGQLDEIVGGQCTDVLICVDVRDNDVAVGVTANVAVLTNETTQNARTNIEQRR